ncbi:Zinc finger, C3HC4 type (RING finger) [Musa troglodytarum]|uniref:Protein ECERIFERUM 7 n=1 Tax=Musa troglodytarum TaxID=320322 RepID=A0A9E7GC95_9LILI|nr:Zinc finger, C3HC4 type (RING finger) [Musa troglodytarum]
MEPAESSRSKEDSDVWAKLVPTDSTYPPIEIRSREAVICSEMTSSSIEKHPWCEIKWSPDKDSATIRNLSSNVIIIDGKVVGEETVNIISGSKITSGPDREVCLTYIFEAMPSHRNNEKIIEISLDVEHAKCSICLNIWHDVVTVAPCLHNFCNGCFSEWLRRSSTKFNDRAQSVAVLQTFSSLKRSDEEIALLNTYASIKSNIVVGMHTSRKRPHSLSNDDSNEMALPCPQCGNELGGFRCNRTTTHLHCQGCGGMMPFRSDSVVPQKCLGCDRAFCGAYWTAQGVDAREFNMICHHETFKPASERTISRIPDLVHQNNQFERDVTERCIQRTGTTLQAVISDWIIKFDNKEIDRTNLQLNHVEMITPMTHLCKVQVTVYPMALVIVITNWLITCYTGFACHCLVIFSHLMRRTGITAGMAISVVPNNTMKNMPGRETMFVAQLGGLSFTCREQGLSEVQLGQTRVMSYVTSQLVQPYRDRPNEGTLSIFTEFSPMADPSFEAGRPGEFAVELGRVIDRGLRESRAMDMESLCVVVGKSVWSIRVDLHIVDNGGNLIDAANIAALAALLTFRRPDCTLGGDDGQELIMHDSEVREPLPLIIHHLPIAVTFAVFGEGNIMVIDPTHKEEVVMGGRMTFTLNSNGDICAVQKAGGVGVTSSIIMQCLQIASAKVADFTSKIKHAVEIYNTERASQKDNHYLVEVANQVSLSDVIMKEKQVENLIEHLAYMPLDELESSNQGDALAVDTRTKHESISQGRYTHAFVCGPANWDPYSRGISSRLATSFPTLPGPSTKVKEYNVVTNNEMTVEYSVEHSTSASSSSTGVLGAPAVRQHTKGPKSLKDAVKLRTRRKSSN